MPSVIGYPVEVKAGDEELVVEAKQRLGAGMEHRQRKREDIWRRSERQYEGNHWMAETLVDDPTSDLITVNLSFSTVNTVMPYITGEDPTFVVSPYSQNATVRNARLQQAMLNRIWRKHSVGAKPAIERAASEYLILGDGYVKVSWRFTESAVGVDEFETVAEIFVDRVNPWDVWMEPESDGIADSRWVCERVFTTRRELERAIVIEENEDGEPEEVRVYPDSVLNQLAYGWHNLDEHEDTRMLEDEEAHADFEDHVILWEFYDKVERRLIVFNDGYDRPLRIQEGVTEAPIVQLPNFYLPRSPYHMGDLEQIWPMQQELNKSRSQLITHRQRNVAKYLYREGVLSNEALDSLRSPIVNQGIEVKGDIPLHDVVAPMQMAPLQAEAYNSGDQAQRDIFEVTGVNEYLRGGTPEIRRTATEASIIEGASNVKIRAKLAAVERAVRTCGFLILSIAEEVFPQTDSDEMMLFLTGPEAEQVNRADVAEELQALTSDGDLAGAEQLMQEAPYYDEALVDTREGSIFEGVYEVEVEQGSTELRNPIFREQKFREFALALIDLAPTLAQLGVNIDAKKVLTPWVEAVGVADVEGIFGGAPAPQMPSPDAAGAPPLPIGPNLGAAQPPMAPIGPDNSGALPIQG